jgi:4-hydroxybenzoate polyprenyltransferase
MVKDFVNALKPLKAINIIFPLLGYYLANNFSFPLTREFALYALIFTVFYGALYLLNDLFDYENDRNDKIKSTRTIASGKISLKVGWAYFFVLMGVTLSGIYFMYSRELFVMFLLLLLINTLYPLIFKRIAYVDGLFISLTPVLKVIAGMMVAGELKLNVEVVPYAVMGWLVAFTLGMEKKNKELLAGQKRDFVIGCYTSRSISIVQYVVLFVMLLILMQYHTSKYLFIGIIIIVYYILVLVAKENRRMRAEMYKVMNTFSHGHVSE